MKKLLVGINASYSHTNIAIRYLGKTSNTPFKEFNINMPYINVLSSIIDNDVLMFSCYIWNIDYVLTLCETIKRIDANKIIVLGGPEVSFECKQLMEENPAIDYIICGEGEGIINPFIKCLENGENPDLKGVFYRDGENIVGEEYYNVFCDMDALPFPYDNAPENKIAYFESSRGCPYRCQYCLSGNIGGGVRFMSLDKIKQSLETFSKMDIQIVKFIDRTFNVNKKRTVEILNLILSLKDNICYHFEIGADLLTDEIIEIFNNAPKGKFQIEAGIQSFNEQTLKTVERGSDTAKICENIKKLRDNMHIHVDLIAGLPFENLESFKESFNKAYALKANMLQLGFLKVLKGSQIKKLGYGISYNKQAPYEVLKTPDLSFSDIVLLKKIDKVVDKIYNSQNFVHSLDYLSGHFGSTFEMYAKLADIMGDDIFNPISLKRCIDTIFEASKGMLNEEEQNILLNLLKFDYISSNAKGNKPECFKLIEEKYVMKDIRKEFDIDKDRRFDVIHINPKTFEKQKCLAFYGEDNFIIM